MTILDGKPITELEPKTTNQKIPHWKLPIPRFFIPGISLSAEILAQREEDNLRTKRLNRASRAVNTIRRAIQTLVKRCKSVTL